MNFLCKFVYLSLTGWPGIYSGGFSQLDGDKDSLLLDAGFSLIIAVRLIRITRKQLLRIILLHLLVEI